MPGPGEVLLAGTDDHLILSEYRRLNYSIEPRVNYCRPSVDVFFESLARNWPMPGVAVLLTGMGRDGARGLLQLRRQGWWTIAQEASSCVAAEMPSSAAEMDAAEEIVPLSRIAEAITPAEAMRAPGRSAGTHRRSDHGRSLVAEGSADRSRGSPLTGSEPFRSIGAIHQKHLGPGEGYIVDTGYVVAFESSVRSLRSRLARRAPRFPNGARNLWGSTTLGQS